MSPTWNNYYVAIVHVEKFTLSWLVQQIGGPSGRRQTRRWIKSNLFTIILHYYGSEQLIQTGIGVICAWYYHLLRPARCSWLSQHNRFTLVPPESGFYNVILQSYYVIYALSVILIITGVIIFYKGRTKTSNLTSSSTRTER